MATRTDTSATAPGRKAKVLAARTPRGLKVKSSEVSQAQTIKAQESYARFMAAQQAAVKKFSSTFDPYKDSEGTYNLVAALDAGVSEANIVDAFGAGALAQAKAARSLEKEFSRYKTADGKYDLSKALAEKLISRDKLIAAFGSDVITSTEASVKESAYLGRVAEHYQTKDGNYDLVRAVQEGTVPETDLEKIFGKDSLTEAKTRAADIRTIDTNYKTSDGYDLTRIVTDADAGKVNSSVLGLFNDSDITSARARASVEQSLTSYQSGNGYDLPRAVADNVVSIDKLKEVNFLSDPTKYEQVQAEANKIKAGTSSSAISTSTMSEEEYKRLQKAIAKIDIPKYKTKDGGYDLQKIMNDNALSPGDLVLVFGQTEEGRKAIKQIAEYKAESAQASVSKKPLDIFASAVASIPSFKITDVTASQMWRGMTPWKEEAGESVHSYGVSKAVVVMGSELLIPFVRTVKHWNEMDTKSKVISLGIDGVMMIPVVGWVGKAGQGAKASLIAAQAGKTASGVGESGLVSVGMNEALIRPTLMGRAANIGKTGLVAGEEIVRAPAGMVGFIKNPAGAIKEMADLTAETLTHPMKTIEGISYVVKGEVPLGESWLVKTAETLNPLMPRHIPTSAFGSQSDMKFAVQRLRIPEEEWGFSGSIPANKIVQIQRGMTNEEALQIMNELPKASAKAIANNQDKVVVRVGDWELRTYNSRIAREMSNALGGENEVMSATPFGDIVYRGASEAVVTERVFFSSGGSKLGAGGLAERSASGMTPAGTVNMGKGNVLILGIPSDDPLVGMVRPHFSSASKSFEGGRVLTKELAKGLRLPSKITLETHAGKIDIDLPLGGSYSETLQQGFEIFPAKLSVEGKTYPVGITVKGEVILPKVETSAEYLQLSRTIEDEIVNARNMALVTSKEPLFVTRSPTARITAYRSKLMEIPSEESVSKAFQSSAGNVKNIDFKPVDFSKIVNMPKALQGKLYKFCQMNKEFVVGGSVTEFSWTKRVGLSSDCDFYTLGNLDDAVEKFGKLLKDYFGVDNVRVTKAKGFDMYNFDIGGGAVTQEAKDLMAGMRFPRDINAKTPAPGWTARESAIKMGSRISSAEDLRDIEELVKKMRYGGGSFSPRELSLQKRYGNIIADGVQNGGLDPTWARVLRENGATDLQIAKWEDSPEGAIDFLRERIAYNNRDLLHFSLASKEDVVRDVPKTYDPIEVDGIKIRNPVEQAEAVVNKYQKAYVDKTTPVWLNKAHARRIGYMADALREAGGPIAPSRIGVIGPYKGDAATVKAVINGTKPVASVATPESLLRAKVSGLGVERSVHAGGVTDSFDFLIYKPTPAGRAAAARVQEIYKNMPVGEVRTSKNWLKYDIDLGEAFGYSINDIRQFVNTNYPPAIVQRYAPKYYIDGLYGEMKAVREANAIFDQVTGAAAGIDLDYRTLMAIKYKSVWDGFRDSLGLRKIKVIDHARGTQISFSMPKTEEEFINIFKKFNPNATESQISKAVAGWEEDRFGGMVEAVKSGAAKYAKENYPNLSDKQVSEISDAYADAYKDFITRRQIINGGTPFETLYDNYRLRVVGEDGQYAYIAISRTPNAYLDSLANNRTEIKESDIDPIGRFREAEIDRLYRKYYDRQPYSREGGRAEITRGESGRYEGEPTREGTEAGRYREEPERGDYRGRDYRGGYEGREYRGDYEGGRYRGDYERGYYGYRGRGEGYTGKSFGRVIVPVGSNKGIEELTPEQLKASVAWRQGMFYYVVPPPYNKFIATKKRPPDMEIHSGPKSAMKTIMKLRDDLKARSFEDIPDFALNLGAFSAVVEEDEGKKKKPGLKFVRKAGRGKKLLKKKPSITIPV
jgi:hypothetical protein